MITLYGIRTSRAMRSLWMLEELGLEYTWEQTDYMVGGTRTPEFLALNPNGHIPVLRDGELVLWESMAINLYLAERYGADTGLWPDGAAAHGLAYQWSLWAVTEVEPHLFQVLLHRALLPENRRDERQVQLGIEALAKPLSVLESTLEDREYLLDGVSAGFTVADLNVAALMSWSLHAGMDLTGTPNTTRWLAGSYQRPIFQQSLSKG